MKRAGLLKRFTPGTQEHRVVTIILYIGHIYNHEFHALNILSHTKVTSNIRARIAPYGFDLSCKIVFEPDKKTGKLTATGTRINRIVRNEGI
jgi:hypothetical protein